MQAGTDDGEIGQLVGLVARGDRQAMRRLYDAESPRLFGVARRLLRDRAAATDALQDAFVQVWQNAGRFDPARGSARGWLTAILRYRALDMARARGRETLETLESLEEEGGPADDRPDALGQLLARRETRALAQCLEALDDKNRRAILLAFIDGYSHSQIASLLDSRLGTVKAWIRRGLVSLRGCLEP